MTSDDKSIVVSFVSELIKKADFGIRGEKPLALIAALKYLRENNIAGKRLLELLAGPHSKAIRSIFIELAQEQRSIEDPAASWNVITGKGKELQRAIGLFRFGDIDKAFSRLTPEEIEDLCTTYNSHLTRTRNETRK